MFDGHGGIRAAEFASQEVPRRIEAKLPQGGLPPSQGLQLFQDVFKQVCLKPSKTILTRVQSISQLSDPSACADG